MTRPEPYTPNEITLLHARWDNDESRTLPNRDVVCRLLATVQKLRAENICDACAGDPSSVLDGNCMCRGTGKMSEAGVYLRERLFKTQSELNNLLAVIHRDGGHYTEKHGQARSVEVAQECVVDLRDRAHRNRSEKR